MHPFRTNWTETNILTQQLKLSWKRAIAKPKSGGWLPISNLTCILQRYKLLQTSNEINASLQTLKTTTKKKHKKKCDNDAEDDAVGQLDPYVSAMLPRRHKKDYWMLHNKNGLICSSHKLTYFITNSWSLCTFQAIWLFKENVLHFNKKQTRNM